MVLEGVYNSGLWVRTGYDNWHYPTWIPDWVEMGYDG